jgi:U3 small nucleolar RNA-associated protein 12
MGGHRAAVTAAKFIEGGALLVSGSQDTDVIVWDVVAEAGVVRLHGHTGPVTDIAHLESENLLLTASKDTLVKVWDLVTQHCVQTIVGHRTEVHSLALSPDESRLYTGAADAELRVWAITAPDDPQTSEATQSAEGVRVVFTNLGSVQRASRDRAETLAISPGGGLLGCQGADKVLELFVRRAFLSLSFSFFRPLLLLLLFSSSSSPCAHVCVVVASLQGFCGFMTPPILHYTVMCGYLILPPHADSSCGHL